MTAGSVPKQRETPSGVRRSGYLAALTPGGLARRAYAGSRSGFAMIQIQIQIQIDLKSTDRGKTLTLNNPHHRSIKSLIRYTNLMHPALF